MRNPVELDDVVIEDVKEWILARPVWRELAQKDMDSELDFLRRAYREVYDDAQVHKLLLRFPELQGLIVSIPRGAAVYSRIRDALRRRTEAAVWAWMIETIRAQADSVSVS